MATARRRCRSIRWPLSVGVKRDEDEIDEFDEDEGDDDAAHPVDPDVSAQDGRRAGRTELHAAKGEGNEGDDYERIEDDRRQDSALLVVQMQDVQPFDLWVRDDEERRDDGKVLRHVV